MKSDRFRSLYGYSKTFSFIARSIYEIINIRFLTSGCARVSSMLINSAPFAIKIQKMSIFCDIPKEKGFWCGSWE